MKLRSAKDNPGGRKVSITIWVTGYQRDRIDAAARKCKAFRAQFLRDCINAGAPAVIAKGPSRENWGDQ